MRFQHLKSFDAISTLVTVFERLAIVQHKKRHDKDQTVESTSNVAVDPNHEMNDCFPPKVSMICSFVAAQASESNCI